MNLKYLNNFRKFLFAFMSAAYLAIGAGMLSTETTKNEREEITDWLSREDIIIPTDEFMRLYTDCDNRWHEKTHEEIIKGIEKRKNLEYLATRFFYKQASLGYVDTTPEFQGPLNGNGRFKNSFNYIRRRVERHNAIDIFSPEGTIIYAPVSGVALASAGAPASSNAWQGTWNRRTNTLENVSGGLTSLSGNGVVLFSPLFNPTRYYLMIHMNEVYVKPGNVVSRGQIIGTVGKTGNAVSPYSESHLHFELKIPGTECGYEGVLVAKNSFEDLWTNRNPFYAQEENREQRKAEEAVDLN